MYIYVCVCSSIIMISRFLLIVCNTFHADNTFCFPMFLRTGNIV